MNFGWQPEVMLPIQMNITCESSLSGDWLKRISWSSSFRIWLWQGLTAWKMRKTVVNSSVLGMLSVKFLKWNPSWIMGLHILLRFCLIERQWLVFAVFLCNHLKQSSVVLLIILFYGLKGKPNMQNNWDKWYKILKHD